jgi:HEAT repeat protein
LIKALYDSNALVRQEAIRALGQFGEKAKAAVPVLLELQKDPLKNVLNERVYMATSLFGNWARSDVEEALKKIDPEAAAAAGFK